MLQALLLRHLRDRINGGTLDLVDILNRSLNLREGFSRQGGTQADQFRRCLPQSSGHEPQEIFGGTKSSGDCDFVTKGFSIEGGGNEGSFRATPCKDIRKLIFKRLSDNFTLHGTT